MSPRPRQPIEPRDGDGDGGRILELERELAGTQAQLKEVDAQREELATQLVDARKKLDEAQQELRNQAGDIGRLQALADAAAALQAERDQARQQLTELTATVEKRVADAVNEAVQRVQAEHEAALEQWLRERDELRRQIEALKKQQEQRGVTGTVAPTVLADHFATVVEDVASARAGARPERPFNAALTGLEVEAKGVLQAPREGETEPQFVTVEAGTIHPAELSTIRMSFKLLPRIPSEGPPPE